MALRPRPGVESRRTRRRRRCRLTVQGLPLVKPPYGRITAIDLKRARWRGRSRTARRRTTSAIIRRSRALTIPRTGRQGRIGTLVTKSLLIAGEGGVFTLPDGRRGAMLRAYDKAHGQGRRRRLHAGAADRLADDLHARRPAVHRRRHQRPELSRRAHRVPLARWNSRTAFSMQRRTVRSPGRIVCGAARVAAPHRVAPRARALFGAVVAIPRAALRRVLGVEDRASARARHAGRPARAQRSLERPVEGGARSSRARTARSSCRGRCTCRPAP